MVGRVEFWQRTRMASCSSLLWGVRSCAVWDAWRTNQTCVPEHLMATQSAEPAHSERVQKSTCFSRYTFAMAQANVNKFNRLSLVYLFIIQFNRLVCLSASKLNLSKCCICPFPKAVIFTGPMGGMSCVGLTCGLGPDPAHQSPIAAC